MGTPSEPALVKPITGILAASLELLAEACDVVSTAVAPIELVSEPVSWRVSTYYEREMGADLWRQYVALLPLEPPDGLAARKLATNQLEDDWRREGRRQVNLDPGYLDFNKVVLASTKDAAHRIYLGHGIYAEATLRFVSGSFQPWPYTYPDYAAPETLRFFNGVRMRYVAQRRRAAGPIARAR